VVDVVFHLIVLRETHEIAMLHGGQILHGCRSYAHHIQYEGEVYVRDSFDAKGLQKKKLLRIAIIK